MGPIVQSSSHLHIALSSGWVMVSCGGTMSLGSSVGFLNTNRTGVVNKEATEWNHNAIASNKLIPIQRELTFAGRGQGISSYVCFVQPYSETAYLPSSKDTFLQFYRYHTLCKFQASAHAPSTGDELLSRACTLKLLIFIGNGIFFCKS